ncbi:RNA methyltransferase [Paenibacillus selenitireducens]|uniref:RNA methyltransferase n=1 Tax=Paenibacillus selenitireducens TaxID=1324314 RepID=A0A1T2X3L6_9BACL|nr:methyltransferase domain-containing protein [Paenibacillus selenitireducens]OPA74306.1 RNA methyltransferase [Paenibacillus selenitireducens]
MNTYLYTYTAHEDEQDLCRLELRSLLDIDPISDTNKLVLSTKSIDPSRSPFIHQRLTIIHTAENLDTLMYQMASIELSGATFKVKYIKESEDAPSYEEQRAIERKLGARLVGKADMRQPERVFGVAKHRGTWMFGEMKQSEAVWLHHNDKPQHYSTALSTRLARAVVNIAVPEPQHVRVIDPCCGIGTVLIEALSMEMDIVGRDINPLAARGARTNLAHFGYPNVVTLGDMKDITDHYDVAIIDMPYNLCSKLSPEEQQAMLSSARRFTDKVVIVTAEPIDTSVIQSGFRMIERCQVRKGTFVREVIVAE